MKRWQIYSGLLSPLIGLGGVLTAIIINRSWWSITDNAISDMGRVGLRHNWVMNSALIIAAILGIYYASGLLMELKSSLQKLGAGIFILGLFSLMAIGLFPEGTSPHYYVSWAFFVMAGLGMLITGIGFYMKGDRNFGAFTAALFVIAWFLAATAMKTFRGVAVSEFIGIFGIVIWHYALFMRLKSTPET